MKEWLVALLTLSLPAQAQLAMPPENDQFLVTDPIEQQKYLNSCEKSADKVFGLTAPPVDVHAYCQCALEHQKFIPKHEMTSVIAVKKWVQLMKITANYSALIVTLTPVMQEVTKLCKAEQVNVP